MDKEYLVVFVELFYIFGGFLWIFTCYWLNLLEYNKGRHVTLKYFSILIRIDKEHSYFVVYLSASRTC